MILVRISKEMADGDKGWIHSAGSIVCALYNKL